MLKENTAGALSPSQSPKSSEAPRIIPLNAAGANDIPATPVAPTFPLNPVPPAVKTPPVQPAPPKMTPAAPEPANFPFRSETQSVTTSSSSPAATVSVDMTGPETASVGCPVTYEIIVRNQNKWPVYQVKVEDELPQGMRYINGEPPADIPSDRLVWNLGILDGGAEKRLRFQVVSAIEGEVPSKATVTFATTATVRTRFTRPRLVVSMTGPESVVVGEMVTFQIQIANNGTGPISKVYLRDRLPDGLQHPQGHLIEAELPGLAPGESKTINLRATAIKGGVQINDIQATAEVNNGIQLAGGIRNPDLESNAKSQVKIIQPGLAVKITGPKTCLVKCEGIFTIDVTNPGTGTATNVKIQNILPEGMEFVAASDDGHFEAGTRAVVWNMPRLEPNAHQVLTIKIRGKSMVDSSIVVAGQADGNLHTRAELGVRVEGVPAISVEVVDVDNPTLIDSDCNIEIRVVNKGSCPCTGIQIMAIMPEGMELREAQAPTPYKVAGQQVQFAPYNKLATRADVVYRLKVRSKIPGDVRFGVQMTCDQLQQPVYKEEACRFYKQ
jgi:uncharacterized repeat protein (TIGR01451 family)